VWGIEIRGSGNGSRDDRLAFCVWDVRRVSVLYWIERVKLTRSSRGDGASGIPVSSRPAFESPMMREAVFSIPHRGLRLATLASAVASILDRSGSL
jgi:hypothetical protein